MCRESGADVGAQEVEGARGAAGSAGGVRMAWLSSSEWAGHAPWPPVRIPPFDRSYSVHSPHQLPLVASTRTCQSLKWSSVTCTVLLPGTRSPASVLTWPLTGRGRARRARIAASAAAQVPLCTGSTEAVPGFAAAGLCTGDTTGLLAVIAPVTAAAPTGPAAVGLAVLWWGMAGTSRRSRAWRTVPAGCCCCCWPQQASMQEKRSSAACESAAAVLAILDQRACNGRTPEMYDRHVCETRSVLCARNPAFARHRRLDPRHKTSRSNSFEISKNIFYAVPMACKNMSLFSTSLPPSSTRIAGGAPWPCFAAPCLFHSYTACAWATATAAAA